jgi:methylase of polypeptide subunit release factors
MTNNNLEIKNKQKINPQITQDFYEDIIKNKKKGLYRIKVQIGSISIPIDVYPGVFPPKSNYSISSELVFGVFGDLTSLKVADIGSGSGIEAIVAILSGAVHVDAVDINPVAVECTRHNVELNNLNHKISVYNSDLFASLPENKYDLIIANLPIVDFNPGQESDVIKALYDPDLKLHKRLFIESTKFLSEEGYITFSHANLQSRDTNNPNKDFEILENLIIKYGYQIISKKEQDNIGYKWISYKIKPIISNLL